MVAEDKHLPKYQSAGAACADLVARIPSTIFGGVDLGASITLNHRGSAKIGTGVKVAIPEGYKLCMALRSSMGKQGVVMNNSPAQIDSDYRGEIEIMVTNVGRDLVKISDGDRIAQCWLEPVLKINWEQVKELDATDRGDGGFGSTGK